jgi:glycosyltransferase involved in cell wall biosynthesis
MQVYKMPSKNHICICICTYKRPELLRRLLLSLEEQETEDFFDYSIVIIDNDSSESARDTVERFASQSKISIIYDVEAKQNIALARNKAIENAKGDFVAFIDDDEFPIKTWLFKLHSALNSHKPSGGVLGPVIPYYPEGTPRWLIKSKICDRPNHSTGASLNWKMTRTGNVLLCQKILKTNRFRFDPKKGRTGGEDKEFFKRLIEHGYTFIWCSEATVYEVIYSDRWKLSYYLNRSLMMGGVAGKKYAKYPLYLLRSFVSMLCYSSLISVSIFRGRHHLYRHFIRVVYDFGRVMGCLGIIFVRERRD